MYIKRNIISAFEKLKKLYNCILITGSRQVGKTTFLQNECDEMKYVTLDNLNNLMGIKNDPLGFFENNSKTLILDEIQRAQDSFLTIKYIIDNYKNKEKVLYILTGSQKYMLMKNISESLAGRIGILEMYGLSNRELYDDNVSKPFIPTKKFLNERVINNKFNDETLWDRIIKGSYPEIYDKGIDDLQIFYSNLVDTYVERDVKELLNIKDTFAFKQFLVMLAARSGQLLNMSEIGKEINVDSKTIKSWISVLMASNIIYLVFPFSVNVNKRIIKTPKIYFLDTGLLCYLAKWYDKDALKTGASAGSIYETFVVSEIIKSYANAGKNVELYYFRTTNQNEIDLLLYLNNILYPIEIKMTHTPNEKMIRSFELLPNYYSNISVGEGGIICNAKEYVNISKNNYIIPIEYI